MRVTRQSPPAMVAFTAFMFVVPYQLGKVVLWTTNPEQQTALEKRLRERSTLEHRVLVSLALGMEVTGRTPLNAVRRSRFHAACASANPASSI